MRMDRPMNAKSKSIDTNGSGKQGRTCSSACGGYGKTISVNGYGNVSVPQSQK